MENGATSRLNFHLIFKPPLNTALKETMTFDQMLPLQNSKWAKMSEINKCGALVNRLNAQNLAFIEILSLRVT